MHIQNANTNIKRKYNYLPVCLICISLQKLHCSKRRNLFCGCSGSFFPTGQMLLLFVFSSLMDFYNKIKGTFEHNKKSDAVTDNVFWNWAEVSADTRLQIADHSFALFQRDLKKRKWEREHLLNLERGQQVDVTGTTVHQSPICQWLLPIWQMCTVSKGAQERIESRKRTTGWCDWNNGWLRTGHQGPPHQSPICQLQLPATPPFRSTCNQQMD